MLKNLAPSMLDNVLKYLRTTSAWRMFLHLIWLMCLLMILSSSYIITFHFVPVLELFKKSHSLTHFSSELATSIAMDQQVNAVLQTMLTQTQANRSYLFRFHNGIPSVNNVPFIFHTMTHELISPGTPRVIVFSQRLPTGILGTSNHEMINRRCVVLNNLDEITDSINAWHYNMRGAVAVVRCPYFSSRGDLLGFVGVDFKESPAEDAIAHAHDAARAAADRLSLIFQHRENR
jgi:hypothetical protein